MDRYERARNVLLWSASVLLALGFVVSGVTKLVGASLQVVSFAKWGYPSWMRFVIGFVEVAAAVALLFPRVTFYGASVLAVLMTGALYTHLFRVYDPLNAFIVLVLFILTAVIGTDRRAWNLEHTPPHPPLQPRHA